MYILCIRPIWRCRQYRKAHNERGTDSLGEHEQDLRYRRAGCAPGLRVQLFVLRGRGQVQHHGRAAVVVGRAAPVEHGISGVEGNGL